jgi:hypothetical protein
MNGIGELGMTSVNAHDEQPDDDIRRRADDWFTNGAGYDALAEALKKADLASRAFRKAAEIDPEVLRRPMTV